VSVTPEASRPSHPEDTGLQVRRSFERSFRAGQVIYEEGEQGDALYVIQSGQVELTRAGPDGPRLVARLGPGELFGELAALLGRRRSSRALAASPSRLLALDAATFEVMCVERPEIAIRVIQRLAARAIDLEQRLAALGVDDLLRPVVRVLLRRAEPAGGGARLATTLRRLARDAGLSLLETHRALGELLDQRLVRLVDDVLEVPDLEALSGCLDAAD
jgi:CRP/FNR family transcriptional regulator, cyclic AMP receptor protein